jgi:hypothetical protein
MLQKSNGVLSFGTLIHSGDFKLPLPFLGQISIGRVAQNSIGTNAMASTLSKKDYMVFSEGLAQYEYINDIGRLDLEEFCVTLAACILHDGIGYQNVAKPENFHVLLIEIIRKHAPEGMFERWVQHQRIVDWMPQHAYLYPNRERTCIHISALMSFSHDWIALIGSDILNIPDEQWRPEYFGWAKESWHFTHTFLSGFHNVLWSFAKKADLKWSTEGVTSTFEALHLSQREDIDYDTAVKRLEIRNKAWSSATSRISKAIEDKYYLEAISLSENFISNLLFNLLSSETSVRADLNFNSMIQRAKGLFKEGKGSELLEKVDLWRKSRNDAIHNFITSSIDDLTANTDTLDDASAETAKTGQDLTKKMLDWYRENAVDFVQHNFPRSELNS